MDGLGRSEGGPVPLTRVKTLVSMTTPRSQPNSSAPPPAVELDMSSEGFGCLYVPSVAPQSPAGPSVVNVATLTAPDSNVVGGIGGGTSKAFHLHTYQLWYSVHLVALCNSSEYNLL